MVTINIYKPTSSVRNKAMNIATDLMLEYISSNQQTTISCGDTLETYTSDDMHELVNLVHKYIGLFRHQIDPEVPRIIYEYDIDIYTRNPNNVIVTLSINYMQLRV
jgi:hypothetical protein